MSEQEEVPKEAKSAEEILSTLDRACRTLEAQGYLIVREFGGRGESVFHEGAD